MIKYIVTGAIVLLLLLWGTTMFYTVEEHEKAAVLTFGNYTKTVEEPGLHFKSLARSRKLCLCQLKRSKIGWRSGIVT